MGLIPNEVSVAFSIVMIIVLGIWSWQMIDTKAILSEHLAQQMEECYYWKCSVDLFGNIECDKEALPTAVPDFNITGG